MSPDGQRLVKGRSLHQIISPEGATYLPRRAPIKVTRADLFELGDSKANFEIVTDDQSTAIENR